jgi:hypothetical protein
MMWADYYYRRPSCLPSTKLEALGMIFADVAFTLAITLPEKGCYPSIILN